MSKISVVYLPSGGTKVIEVTDSTTVKDIVDTLHIDETHKIVLDGDLEVAVSDYSTTLVKGCAEVWALKGSKGA